MNRIELRGALVAAGLPDDLYSLQGVHDLDLRQESFYLLGGSGDDVRAGVFERNNATFGYAGTEEDACEFLYRELVFEGPEPAVFDEADEAVAAERSKRLTELVDFGMDEAAQRGEVISIEFHLRPGDVVDRFGAESGSYLFPDGTPAERRSQPPTAIESGYYRYLVTGDIPVRAGVTGPAFGQPGGAAMFKLDPGVPGAPPLLTVRWLVRVGLLRPVVERA